MTERRLWSLSGRLYAAIAAIEERPGEMLPRRLRGPIRECIRALLQAQQDVIRVANEPNDDDCDGQCACCSDPPRARPRAGALQWLIPRHAP